MRDVQGPIPMRKFCDECNRSTEGFVLWGVWDCPCGAQYLDRDDLDEAYVAGRIDSTTEIRRGRDWAADLLFVELEVGGFRVAFRAHEEDYVVVGTRRLPVRIGQHSYKLGYATARMTCQPSVE